EGSKKGADATAFAFQLVPQARSEGEARRWGPAAGLAGKTHHFAVRSQDERIDWMRELMLAKALQAKGKGFEVEVNGVQA
ncbi:Sterile alpha motif, partial [Teratosphaeria destructans]